MNMYAAIKEAALKENYGDSKDYSKEIESLFKKWAKDNSSLFTRIAQKITSGYDFDVESKEVGTDSDRAIYYKVTNESLFPEGVQKYQDEIGNYITSNIPAVKYIDKDSTKGNALSDEDAGKTVWYFKQQIGIPDFNECSDETFTNGKVKVSDSSTHCLKENTRVAWSYFGKFDSIIDKYIADRGEGETMASQIVAAVNKLIYKWYNDGDVYDNVHSYLAGWANDLSSYANWLYNNVPETKDLLLDINGIKSDDDYDNILKGLADLTLSEDFLSKYLPKDKVGSIYSCSGPFEYKEVTEEYDF